MKNKQFTGDISIESSSRPSVNFRFDNSLLKNVKVKKSSNGRVSECDYWASDGGNNVFNCAGRTFRDYDWLERSYCVFSGFFGCMGMNMYACYKNGCEYI